MAPYVPNALPLTDLDFSRIIRKVGPANAALARYDGLLQGIVNASVLLSPLTTHEAVLSSKIEGTQATVDEVLEYEAGMDFGGDKAADIQEVVNYREGPALAREALDRPADLAAAHPPDARRADGQRAWLQQDAPAPSAPTRTGSALTAAPSSKATFVPPAPLQLLRPPQAFEAYLGREDFDALVQAAVVHAQFELIHPFKDGNGRIGRLIIPLFLYQKRALASPMFYPSEYLESHRELYYERLRGISQDGDWTGWIEFFLDAVDGTGALQHREGEGTSWRFTTT